MTASPVSAAKVKSGAKSPSRTAVGIVRVSRVGSRSGEQFVSPKEQRTRIDEACARDKLKLVAVLEELDVSGGAPLEKRPGLRRAVEMVEVGEAQVIVAGYFDRLVRSLQVQAEVVERVEAAGGRLLAVDVGAVTGASAGQSLSGTMLGAVSEYHRRVTAERTAEAKRRAIARGVPTFANIPPGYRRRDDGTLEPDPVEAPIVAEAFRLRAEGTPILAVREYLRDRGISRSFHGTTSLLESRMYMGELRFGDLVNTESHQPIVDADLWARVQRIRLPRGRRAKSDLLLARQGLLRCGSCGARMVVGTAKHSRYHVYRCPPVNDCPQHVTVTAAIVEPVVIDAVKVYLEGVEGSAGVDQATDQAAQALDAAETELAKAVEAFSGLDDVQAAKEKLQALREARDGARARLDELEAAQAPAVTVTAEDWDVLTLDERRALIRAVIERVDVAPGRGPGRVSVTPRC